MKSRVGVVGARGHVGSELLPILLGHPGIEVAWVTSSSAAGEPVPGAATALRFHPADVAVLHAEPVDALVLALPNGQSAAWVEAVEAEEARARADSTSNSKGIVVVDLSSDHRFDDAWTYGQAERFRARLRGALRIAAPGCYATAASLAIWPLLERARGAFHVFGVSGYSGAGTAKSERNDPDLLRDNLIPYALTGHAHERELRRHLGHAVFFSPHVASFFRGLVVTVHAELDRPSTLDELAGLYARAYGAERFVEVVRDPPRPRDMVGRHDVRIGGLALGDDGQHAVVVAALDNLLGGAASHAVRALNLALGHDEEMGLR